MKKEKRNEVISMKIMTAVLMTMALVLAYGIAYADDDIIMAGKDVGTELYDNAYRSGDIAMDHKDFARVPNPLEANIEVGAVLGNTTFAKDEVMFEASGSAAGGTTKDSDLNRIWDRALGPGGSDLP
jgi:hypothetical protein